MFPKELEITASDMKKILFIGSCLSTAYVKSFKNLSPSIEFEHILFNNAADLPKKTTDEISEYSLQYIQIPLRSVLTDAIIGIYDNDNRDTPLDWVELGKRNISVMLEKALLYNELTGILTVVSGFIVPQGSITPSISDFGSSNDFRFIVEELNRFIIDFIKDRKNVYYADVDMIAGTIGKRYFLDDFVSFYSHGSVHYPDWREYGRIEQVPPFVETYENRVDEFFEAVFRQIEFIYRVAHQIDQVKLVIFDLDNTLWRGQLVEDFQPGLNWPHQHGWPIGIWETVQQLRWRGIVTAVSSKNDEDVVRAKWSDAVNLPFVKLDDFVQVKINWKPKAQNIAEILSSLSLTAKSAVFVDDNPVERESVKSALPGLRVTGSNPYLIRRTLLWAPETQIASRSDESLRREKMLKANLVRHEEKARMSHEDFLNSLGTKMEVYKLLDMENAKFSRVLELVNKTNQFNTTGKRWTVADFNAFWQQNGQVFAFSVSDRFTDYGLVGVAFLRECEIVQFVMSCRTLGMEVENAAISILVNSLRTDGGSAICGGIIETSVNMPCRDLFTKNGFNKAEDSEGLFVLPEGTKSIVPPHISVNLSNI